MTTRRDPSPRPGPPAPGVSPQPGDFRAQFESGSWMRGAALAAAGHVVSCRAAQGPRPGQWLLDAVTEGSAGTRYGQMMLLERVGHLWSVDGRCDCPVGHLCKHQAAVLQSFLPFDAAVAVAASKPEAAIPVPLALEQAEAAVRAEEDRRAQARLEARRGQQAGWLQALQAAARPAPLPVHGIAPDEALLYRLQHHPARAAQGPWLSIWPGKATRLKTRGGGWGKFRPAPGAPAPANYYAGHDALYQTVQRWMTGQSHGRYGAVPTAGRIEDAVGVMLLERIVAGGAAMTLGGDGHPERFWRWGPPRRLVPRWQRVEAAPSEPAQWTLAAQVEPGPAVWALADPAVYLDETGAEIGPLVLEGIDVRQLPLIAQQVPLEEGWLRAHALEIGLVTLPPPAEAGGAEVRRIDGVPPRGLLHARPRDDGGPGLMLLALAFDYAGQRGSWRSGDPLRVCIDGPAGPAVLVRDPAAERQWVERLRAAGLHETAPAGAWAAPDGPEAELALVDADFAALRAAGFDVTVDPELRRRVHRVESIDIALADGAEPGGATARHGWFALSLGFRADGQQINLLPFLPQLIARHASGDAAPDGRAWISDANGHHWQVPLAELRPWLDALLELAGEPSAALDAPTLRLTRIDALRAAAAGADGGAGLAAMAAALREHRAPSAVPVPATLAAHLRPYQLQGLHWLQWLGRVGLGGVLADDMGLGKTLQAIAHLLADQEAGRLERPALVVAPTSLVGNWRREIERFAPTLRTLVLHGLERHGRFEQIGAHDVVLTTYPLLARDAEVLARQTWHAVVLDEAQTIKNAKTQAAQIVRSLDTAQRLALTGTPMENHLGELWSLFQFLAPGYLGTEARFRQLFRTPIEKAGDADRLALLRRRIAPFMLRRTKAMVATELPPKVESIERVRMEPAQANLYETIRLATETSVRDALQKKGLARSQITVLDALLKLRQACCDPQLVKLAAARRVKASAKMDWLRQTLPEMVDEGRRILVFSQFTSLLALVEPLLDEIGIAHVKLTGDSTRRDAIVEKFTTGEVPVFLISLKAGGVGLNLPQADTVIHLDPWWNPAAESQATDRAHRIGQTQTVFVYKLVAEGTLEERILTLQERKAGLARGLHGQGGGAVQLSENDIDWLLRPLGDVVAEAEDPLAPEPVPALSTTS